jgi:transcriptional regulator with XRE-family HTH domain
MALRQERVVETLIALRERHSLGQEDAARKIGIGLRQYQRWEAGESMPRASNLGRAALAYGVSPTIFYDDEELPASSVPQLDRMEAAIKELATAVAMMSVALGELREEIAPRRRRHAS